ncbi:MAG: ABC transporter substrate-binding protein [Ectothiorhodospiraceae bacterium]|jgi:branched-chain amino acid transport system substrate-binding protein
MLRGFFKKAVTAVSLSVLALSGTAMGADTIKIGSFLAVTGPASFLGDPELKTLQLYIDRINADGGVLGKKLELVHYDDGANAGKARTFAKRLITADQVDLIIGGTTTGTTMAVIPLVQQYEVPFISLAGGVPIIDPVKKWVFKTPHTDRMAVQKIYRDMQRFGVIRVGLISGTGGFGKSCRQQALDQAGEYNISVVADETYGPKDTDMTAQLTKIKGTDGVQAVLNCGFGQGPAIVTKNFRQLGLDVPLYESHGVASKSYIELAGDAANGVRLPAAALLVADKLPDSDPQKPVVVDYKNSFEKNFDQSVSTFGGHAYDALQIAVGALERAGSTDKAAVRSAIEQTSGLIGTGGEFNLSPEDHLGLDLSAFRMLEIKNGEWTLAE